MILASQDNLIKVVSEVRDILNDICEQYEALYTVQFGDMFSIQTDLEESINKLSELLFYMGILNEKLRVKKQAAEKRNARKKADRVEVEG